LQALERDVIMPVGAGGLERWWDAAERGSVDGTDGVGREHRAGAAVYHMEGPVQEAGPG
jgi:hypothetical protein